MSRVKYSRYKDQLLLYLINVYQPCTVDRIRKFMRASSIEAFKGIRGVELRRMLERVKRQDYLLESTNGQLCLTHLGGD